MLTASKIKIIYCYVVCFAMVMIITISTSILINNGLKRAFFESTYIVPEHVKKERKPKHLQPPKKNMSPEEMIDYEYTNYVEIDRNPEDLQKAIQEDKKLGKTQILGDILWHIAFIFWSLLVVGVHVFIIKRTKES